MTPEPLSPFVPANRVAMTAGAALHRIHDNGYGPTAFNPCLGRPSRFAPLRNSDGTCIPTLYAATSYECAVHETVFHEIQHDADRKAMRIDAILRLHYSTIAPRRELVLAALFEPDLNRWGLTRRDLIDTYASAYAATARWAKAIHDADPEIDGMVWTSRRCDPERAFVLFGDRVRPEDLGEISRAPITSSGDLMGQLRGFAARAGIFVAT
jgi:hypothetical protein